MQETNTNIYLPDPFSTLVKSDNYNPDRIYITGYPDEIKIVAKRLSELASSVVKNKLILEITYQIQGSKIRSSKNRMAVE
jgi:hypothetical protein